MDQKKTGLSDAYALSSPEDNRKLYADWAGSYDSDFAAEMDYQFPAHVADAFVAAGGQGPVLDVGAGTGLVAKALLKHQIDPIDATDISPEMLEIARAKGHYRDLFVSDITSPTDVPDGTYSGVISAGTFTHGHVGPEAFDELIRITRPGGQLAIAINAAHFDKAGFSGKLENLCGKITGLELLPVQIYGDNAKGNHAADKGLIALFRAI